MTTPVRAPGGIEPAFAQLQPSTALARRTTVWIAVVAVCAFGPYVIGGMRTEQLAVYGSAAIAVLLGWTVWRRSPQGSSLAPFALLWLGITTIAAVGAVWPPLNATLYDAGDPIAGLDNLALPIAAVVLTAFWCELVGSRTVATTTCLVVIVVMVINAVVAFVARVHGDYGLTPWVEAFWARGDAVSVAVATNALGNERYTGFFNQPTEAGICYSLALLSIAYVVRLRTRPHTALIAAGGILLAIGGVLAVSKVVLLGGLPLFALALLSDRVRRWRVLLFATAAVLLLAAVGGELLEKYLTGTAAFRALFGEAPVDATALSGGRLGQGGTLASVADQVSATNPWFGLGAGGNVAPYDSSWIEAMVTAGTVGSILLGAIFAALAVRWFNLRSIQPAPESFLAAGVLLLVAGASMGMPSLTGNKVSTILWILLTCLLMRPREPLTRISAQLVRGKGQANS